MDLSVFTPTYNTNTLDPAAHPGVGVLRRAVLHHRSVRVRTRLSSASACRRSCCTYDMAQRSAQMPPLSTVSIRRTCSTQPIKYAPLHQRVKWSTKVYWLSQQKPKQTPLAQWSTRLMLASSSSSRRLTLPPSPISKSDGGKKKRKENREEGEGSGSYRFFFVERLTRESLTCGSSLLI